MASDFFTRIMRKRVLFPFAAVSLLSCLFAYLLLGDFDVYAQRERVAGPNVKQTASVKKVEAAPSFAFNRAASENATLRSSLSWTFSGKTQTGWNIYVPLIANTIGTEASPDTSEFALELSKWQGRAGLPGTGVLDNATIETFTKYWQSRRLGRFSLSADDSLLSAPIAEFYDATRSPDLLQLEQETFAAYKKMIAAAAKDLKSELRLTKNGELAPE